MATNEPPGCLLAILSLFGGSSQSDKSGSESADAPELYPFRLNESVMSPAERVFFNSLQTAVGDRYLVFSMVRLADLISVQNDVKSKQRFLNQIQSKHIDFVLCDRDSVRTLLAIELDDSSHNRADRKKRDAFVDSALAAAGLPLLRIPARAGYDPDKLQKLIEKTIAG